MFEDFIKYTTAADEIIIEIFETRGQDISKAVELFSHVLNAQHIWMKRILSKNPDFKVWDICPVNKFREIHRLNMDMMVRVSENEDPEKEIVYVNSKGEQFTSKVKDILFHVVNHSTYHRGQIATLFKAAGITPPVTDFIMLKRENLI